MSTSQQPVPPQSSSHTALSSRQVIRISPLSYIGCAFLLFAVTFPVFAAPAVWGWLLLAPIVAVIWVARVRTTVGPDGVDTRRLFGSTHLDWDRIKGVRFTNRGWARAELTDGGETVLPVVTFAHLPVLSLASDGRIPDPYAAAAEAEEHQPAEDDR
ncbi:PH domain-containing protein [Rhodococcus triatomae]|uniref:PH domain-containing protein n=1 Tax=Rhodococcus triatomae TaxID=300028 RepID=UPI001FE3D974|nr:PH domain-containing protein [Rhodococcus triatomae]